MPGGAGGGTWTGLTSAGHLCATTTTTKGTTLSNRLTHSIPARTAAAGANPDEPNKKNARLSTDPQRSTLTHR